MVWARRLWLDDQLWIRRQRGTILVPEPRRLLLEWAEKYKERYRWRLRSSFATANLLGNTLKDTQRRSSQPHPWTVCVHRRGPPPPPPRS